MHSDLQKKILINPTAQRLIKYNTTGFYAESLVGLWLYQVIGLEIDDLSRWVEEIKWQRFPQTVTWGISWWEQAFGLPVDETLSLEERRRRLRTRGRLGGPINPARIEQLVKDATGYDTVVTEHVAPYTFQVDVCTGTKELIDPLCIYNLLRPRKQSHKSMRINFKIEGKPGIVQIGAYAGIGGTINVYPFRPTCAHASGNLIFGAYSKSGGIFGVFPVNPVKASAKGAVVVGGYSMCFGKIGVFPKGGDSGYVSKN